MINFTNPTPFTDPQNQALTLTATGVPAWLTFNDNGNGTYTVTGTAPATGSPWTINVTATDTDNNTSTAHVLTIDCGAIAGSSSGQGSCAGDDSLPEPITWCGVGIVPNTSPAALVGLGLNSEVCPGLVITRLINTDEGAGETLIDFNSPIPAGLILTVNPSAGNPEPAQTIDLSAFAGSNSASIVGINGPLNTLITGDFTVSGNC